MARLMKIATLIMCIYTFFLMPVTLKWLPIMWDTDWYMNGLCWMVLICFVGAGLYALIWTIIHN